MLLNGKPASPDQLRALALTNFGHFTSMRVENGRVRGLALHMNRLAHDCRVLFGADLDLDYVRHLIRQAIEEEDGPVVARVTVFDPSLDLGHPGSVLHPEVLVTKRSASGAPLLPAVRLMSVPYQRELPGVKHVGLFGSMHYRRQAQLAGFDDVVFTDDRGWVSEGATWNLGFVTGGDVIWPDSPCLPGVTMDLLKQAHPSVTAPINVADLHQYEAAFMTNAAIGVREISGIDALAWKGPNQRIEVLSGAYMALPDDQI